MCTGWLCPSMSERWGESPWPEGWTRWLEPKKSRVLPPLVSGTSSPPQVDQQRPQHFQGAAAAHPLSRLSPQELGTPRGVWLSGRCPERPHQPVQNTSRWNSEMQTSDPKSTTTENMLIFFFVKRKCVNANTETTFLATGPPLQSTGSRSENWLGQNPRQGLWHFYRGSHPPPLSHLSLIYSDKYKRPSPEAPGVAAPGKGMADMVQTSGHRARVD